ncbi:MAG: hypothetical protein AAGJ81_03690 [Verrucomicrobiota bacterium]
MPFKGFCCRGEEVDVVVAEASIAFSPDSVVVVPIEVLVEKLFLAAGEKRGQNGKERQNGFSHFTMVLPGYLDPR